MKPFNVYQYLEGEEMTDRDKIEVGSKFWNKGKWDNFVLPLLPEDASEKTLIDIGCNKGLFLYLAKEHGFKRAIGVDSNEEAINKGIEWRDKHGEDYELIWKKMEECVDDLPMADYTILANTHYYFTINDWLDYLDKLEHKTCFTIIVTAEKHHKQLCWASADPFDINGYFKSWYKCTTTIDPLPTEGDPMPRKLWSMCFSSKRLRRAKLENIRSHNSMKNGFFDEIGRGVPYKQTKYYSVLKPYRKRWTEGMLNRWFEERVRVFEDVKKNGFKRPIYVNSEGLILDGNHRFEMAKALGHKSVIVRDV